MSNKLVKVILAGEQVFPQTVAESVLVNGTQVLTLDKVLDRKIENIEALTGSNLKAIKSGTSVIISHGNVITPNDTPEAKLVQFDQTGHIISVDDVKKQTVTVNGEVYSEYNGNAISIIALGDDFKINENNNISLIWGEINKH